MIKSEVEVRYREQGGGGGSYIEGWIWKDAGPTSVHFKFKIE